MSIESIADQARRAIVGTPAKRNSVFVYEDSRSFTTASHKTVSKTVHRVGVALSVSKAGEVTRWRAARDSFAVKGRPARIAVIRQPLDVDAVCEAVAASDHGGEFGSVEQVRTFLRPFLLTAGA